MPALTPAQCRAARAILGWTQAEVASAANLSTKTVKRAEGSSRPPASTAVAAALRRLFETAGVAFIDGERAGLRIARPGKIEARLDPDLEIVDAHLTAIEAGIDDIRRRLVDLHGELDRFRLPHEDQPP